MLRCRAFVPDDYPDVMKLYRENNQTDIVDFPDILLDPKVVNKIVVLNDGNIVGFACVNYIPEIKMVHNKSLPIKQRQLLYYAILKFMRLIGNKCNYYSLYAFCDNDSWIHHLLKVGFKKMNIYYLTLEKNNG